MQARRGLMISGESVATATYGTVRRGHERLMTLSTELLRAMKREGIDFVVSIPCKLLHELLGLMDDDVAITHLPVTREEEGVGIVAGAYLAGRRPAMVMQNSGFGNSVNAVCALLNYYGIAVPMFMSHRGSDGEPIEAQRQIGGAIKDVLTAAQVACYEVLHVGHLDRVSFGIRRARSEERSVGFLFPFRYWHGKG